jgi:putative toxin-antitoxin system antitoxin component (TIGR02293 family)
VRKGYSIDLVKHAGMFFNIPEKRVLQVIGVSGSTAHRYKAQGRLLDPAASERLHRMAVITREAEEVLGDASRAKSWLLQRNLALGNVAPFDLLDTEIGAAAVRRVLIAIAEGGVV